MFVDSCFGANMDCSSQFGFLITLMDKNGSGKIIHCVSLNSKPIMQKVLPEVLFATVEGFDVGSNILLTFNSMFDNVIPLHFYT